MGGKDPVCPAEEEGGVLGLREPESYLGDSCTPWTFEDGPDSAGCLHGSGGSQGLQPDRAQCHGISKGRERVRDSWGRSRTSVPADTAAPTTSTIRGGPCPEGGTGLPTPRPPGELLSHQISAFLGGALKVVIHEVQGLFLLSAFQPFPVHDLSQDERPPDTKISQPFTQFSPVARAPSPRPTEYACLTNLAGTTSRERRHYSR